MTDSTPTWDYPRRYLEWKGYRFYQGYAVPKNSQRNSILGLPPEAEEMEEPTEASASA